MTVGRSILSTRNTYRAFRNVGETAGRMMLTTNGGGIDDYSRAISGLKLPEDLNRMTEISDHYGYFTSPRPRRRTPEHRRNLRADSETSMVTEPAAFEALTKPPSQEAPSHTVIVPASVGLPRRFSIDSFISLAGGRSLEVTNHRERTTPRGLMSRGACISMLHPRLLVYGTTIRARQKVSPS